MWAEQAVCGWELLESDLRLNKRSFPALLLRFIWGHLSGCHPSLRLFQEVVSLRRWGWAFGRCALISPHKGHGALCPGQTPTTLGTGHWDATGIMDTMFIFFFLFFFACFNYLRASIQFSNQLFIHSFTFFLSFSISLLYYPLLCSFTHSFIQTLL